MYGDIGTKLVQHAKRTLALQALPPYQTDLVLSCTRETVSLNKECDALLAPLGGHFSVTEDPALGATLVVNHACMRRNKRCLLAYHKIRTDKLEETMWRGEDVLETPTNTTPLWSERNLGRGNNTNTEYQPRGTQDMNGDQQQNNLSPEEEEYVRGYGELLAEYKGMWTDIDLTGSLEPPRDLFIDVRVLKDAGEIQTEYGSITLTKNSQFYVRQGDVERLIAQGYLQKLS